MLSVRIICVGKLGEKFWKQACDEYMKRLQGYCKPEIIELPEQRLPERPSQGQINQALQREAEIIRQKIPSGAAVIAMCIEGKQMSSKELANKLKEMTVSGISKLVILVGGSCGLDDTLKQQAKLQLSMSSMTFPHHLARVMILEQLFRAFNIVQGGQYHK